ncbi:MAG TPA: glycoside hydrolase family 2 TIM barrel-domain containing protein [Candidatus Didemnitutus sp.]
MRLSSRGRMRSSIFLFLCSALGLWPAPAPARQVESFDVNWRFHLGDAPGAETPSYHDADWRTLDLPHDWSIEGSYDEHAPSGGTGGYLPMGIGWYRKSFRLPASARGQSVRLRFDGVYQHATVWLNGRLLGTRPYGYSSFEFDLTPFLTPGDSDNVVAIRVDNSAQPNSRWYSGSGIYRHTWLTVEDAVHVSPWGICVTTPEVSSDHARVNVRANLRNDGTTPVEAQLDFEIMDEQGASVATAPAAPEGPAVSIAPGSATDVSRELVVASPRRWSPTSPHLYRLRCVTRVGGKPVDETVTTFGIRTISYDVDRGLLLNGLPVKIKGVCLHHDGGAVGAAVPEAVLERRLRLLQEMGCNAIRTSHNPMAPEFYDLCDRLGFLVLDEAFDEWTIRKPQIKFGYSDVFADWSEEDVVTMIHRDRNHPSVVMWSAGNEIGEQWAKDGPRILGRLVEIFHREDPTRPVTAAMDNIFNQHGEAPVAFSGLLDIVGYNYGDRWGTRRETVYADDRHDFPQRRFLGTEDTSARGTRGDYQFGPLLGVPTFGDQTAPGHGPAGALYLANAIHAGALWRFIATHDYAIGDFIWTGFDYLGEAHWPAKLSPDGPLDTCGFKKDSFFFYQSIWSEKPMVHLLPHWNWPDRAGRPIPVVVYSNCVVVELFLNGRSLGAKAREFPSQGTVGGWNSYALPTVLATTNDLQLVWDVPYEPGELKAVGYDRSGAPVTETVVRTAGPAARLELTVDRAGISADARDVAHVTVRALDRNGVFVPLADPAVSFTLAGPARLIGVDNGDPTSHASYRSTERALFHGMALALVQSTREAGPVTVTAEAPGLASASVSIVTQTPR